MSHTFSAMSSVTLYESPQNKQAIISEPQVNYLSLSHGPSTGTSVRVRQASSVLSYSTQSSHAREDATCQSIIVRVAHSPCRHAQHLMVCRAPLSEAEAATVDSLSIQNQT